MLKKSTSIDTQQQLVAQLYLDTSTLNDNRGATHNTKGLQV